MPTVVFAQPAIMHYRLPVFDELGRLASGRYEVKVCGPMKDGEAFGGGNRDYLHHLPMASKRWLGLPFSQSPGLIDFIESIKPRAVVISLNPRNLDCYQLPKHCRRAGVSLIGWSKIHSVGRGPKLVKNLVRRRLFRRYRRIICYGRCSQQELTGLGYPEHQTWLARNTIDTRRIFAEREQFRAKAAELRERNGLDGRKIVLCIARLDPDKRVDDLLDAWPKISQADNRATLVIVGGGQLLDHLRERASSIDADRIRVLGRVPEGEDYTWIAAADANVQCGVAGLAINQSLAFGVPTVIADEWGADTEIIEHGVTGWRYPKGDLQALADAVIAALAKDQHTSHVTSQAERLMRDEVNIENMAAAIDRCVTDALASSN